MHWAAARGFESSPGAPSPLSVLALVRAGGGDTLRVYIEGDGAAWSSPYHPPADPTPDAPVGLALAAADPASPVAYLGRPCQYRASPEASACPVSYWTSHRFSPEIVEHYLRELDRLKNASRASRLHLAGYSGGGVLALLLAARRDDVIGVTTVAAPVSVAEWTEWHGASRLDGSLDPAREEGPLPPTIHFVGDRDRVVPEAVVAPFVTRKGGRLRVVPGFDHHCCWSRDWRRLLEEMQ